MSKKTVAIICFILFSNRFPIGPMAAIWCSRDFDKIKFEIQSKLKNVIYKRRRLYVSELIKKCYFQGQN